MLSSDCISDVCSSDLRAWRAVAHRLASHGFRTIAVDMRGHGESAWASDVAYDISEFAADLVEIAAATASKPALIGASLGGLAGIIAEGKDRKSTRLNSST